MSDKNVPARKYNNYSTPQQVGANSFTSTLGVLCEKNNLFGLYVKESNGIDTDHDEMYFICGLDEETVRKAYKNVVEEYEDQEKKFDKFKFLHVTKLTDHSPVSSYIDVANFCLHASTIRGICNKYGFNKQFDEISGSFCTFLEIAYLDTLKPGLSAFERRKRDNIVKELLETQGEKEFRKEKNEIPKIEDAPLKPNISNMVTLQELIGRSAKITKLVISSKTEEDKLINFFKNNSNIPFYQTKPIKEKLNVPDDRMFGSKENNTFYSSIFLFPDCFESKVDLAYLKIISDPSVKFNSATINNDEICSFGVSSYDINGIFKLASEKKIPLWIDENQLYYDCDPNKNPKTISAGYRIIGPLSMQKEIGLLLNEYAVGYSTKRILSYDDFNRYNKNNSNIITYEEYQKNTQDIGR